MGLDSVELLVSFENYFGITIPDQEAEKINKISEVRDSVCRHLGITSSHTALRDNVFAVLQKALIRTGISHNSIHLRDYLKDVFNYDPEIWQQLERETGLNIPPFPMPREDTFIDRLISRMAWKPQVDYDALTFSDFCDVICAANYQTLLNARTLGSSYEVYIALMAITEDKIGVDFYEIKPDKRFTDDFGID